MVAADLNGDGATDLAVANRTDNTVSILLNDKTGKFPTNSPTYATGHAPVALAAGNFRLTGHMDLAVANSGDSTISILPNDGTGKFGAPITLALPVNSIPAYLVTGDFNGDGTLDLAVANSNMISIFLNKAGTFAAPANITVNGTPEWLATGSLRNNKILDLVAIFNGQMAVLLGKGNGTFAPPTYYAFQSQSSSDGITLADMNADGILDVVIANYGESTAYIMLGKGDGTFLPPTRYEITCPLCGGGTAAPAAILTADFNGDGFEDFVVVNSSSTYTVFLNTPAAAVWPPSLALPTKQLGQTSTTKTGTLYSAGLVPLTPKVTVTPTDYTATADTCGAKMLTGSSCTVTLTFSPKDINSRAGSVSFADAATETPQKISLSGTGSEVSVSPNPVNFKTIVHGTSESLAVTIKNISGGSFPAHTLSFTSIAAAGTGFSETNNCPTGPATLAAGATCTVTVKFAPATAGTFTGTLTITDNGGGSPQKITLNGKGT
jgi:hypothetical protein